MFGMSISSVSSIVTKKQEPVLTRVYSLSTMTTAAPVNGNVSVFLNNSASRIYLSAGVGNLYVGDVAANTWTQSTLAAGSGGQLENRNWRDIVCDGTGQYVVACVSSPSTNDPNGVVFYSTDYGNTFTVSQTPIDTPFCFNFAMSDNGNYTYMTTLGVAEPVCGGSNNNATGNLYVSYNKGITWTRMTTPNKTAGTPSTGTLWISMPSQVRCNSSGEYLTLGVWGSTGIIVFSNYGNTMLSTQNSTGFGVVNSNPVLRSHAQNPPTPVLSYYFMARGSGNDYASFKSIFYLDSWGVGGVVGNTVGIFGRTFAPSTGVGTGSFIPQPNTRYPWTGARNVVMSTNRQFMIKVDTAGLGNVWITTNGLAKCKWPDEAGATNINTFGDMTNLTIAPNAISQNAVPRSAWCGLCVNYNDHFAFANKTGTVYIYSWTLQ